MKVICIDASLGDWPTIEIEEGEIYTVIGESPYDKGFILLEVHCPYNIYGAYKRHRFIPLSDIDEKELVNQREEECIS